MSYYTKILLEMKRIQVLDCPLEWKWDRITKVKKMNYDYLVLNIDKTIFDIVEPVHTAYRQLAKRYGIDLHPSFLERVLDTRGASRERLDREFVSMAKLHDQAIDLSAYYIQEKLTKNNLLSDSAKAFLRFLNEHKIAYGVVSSMPRSFVEQMLRTYPVFKPAFSIVQAEVFEGKPEPDLYLKASRKAGVHPTRLLVVESTELGAESAFLAYAKVVFIESLTQRNPEGSAYSLRDFANLDELALFLLKNHTL